MKEKKGFTLVEIMVVCVLVALVSGVLYKMMSGTFSQMFKSQTKLTNLRAASIIIENLKKDLRLAIIPAKTSQAPSLNSSAGSLDFSFFIKNGAVAKKVVYTYNNGIVQREFDGKKRKINLAKVADLKIEELKDAKGNMLAVTVVVDKDKDLVKRSGSNKANKVKLQTFLFPRFFKGAITKEEKYWNLARNQ